jgi:hypothetical protein
MRVAGKIMLFGAALLLVAYAAAPAQQFGGGGFGGFGGGQQDITTLLRNASVKKEIKLTDEQLEKVPAAVLKALGDVLTPEQLTRLKQIDLQQRRAEQHDLACDSHFPFLLSLETYLLALDPECQVIEPTCRARRIVARRGLISN